VEQGFHSVLGKNIQARIVYHLVNVSGTWRCDFYSVAMIPLNEELSKLDMALEKKPVLEQKHDRTLYLMHAMIITGIAGAKKAGMSVVVVKNKINFKEIFSQGPVFEVTYEDLLLWWDVVSQKIAGYLGASYQQEILEGDWLKATLTKNQ